MRSFIRPRLRAYLYVRERSAPLPSHAQTRLASTSPSALLPALTSPLGGPGTLSSVRRVSPYNTMSPAKSMLFVVACAAAGAAQAADVTLIWGRCVRAYVRASELTATAQAESMYVGPWLEKA